MKKQFKNFAIITIALCFSCTSSDDTPIGTGGGESIQATYKITFISNFTSELHPTDYPSGAVFIRPILVTHSSATSIFSLGSLASAGIELYAEEGNSSGVFSEHTQSQDNVNPTTIIQASIDVTSIDIKEYTITFTPDKTMFSFITRISPSPDWFLGVDSFSILNPDNSLIESKSFKLYAIDAGSILGDTYMANGGDESSAIVERTGLPLSIVANQTGNFLGTLNIEKIISN